MPKKQLTAKEQRVLEALLKGELNKEISDDMNMALNTVKKHVTNIYKKIGVRNRSEVVIWYINVNMDTNSIKNINKN